MAESKESYILTGNSLEEVTRSLNFILQRLSDRMDQIEGHRGVPTFSADVNMGSNRITAVGAPTAATDAERHEAVTGVTDSIDTHLARTNLNAHGNTIDADITMDEGVDINTGTTTGTTFPLLATQKFGAWGATPIVQPTTSVAAATFAANTSGIVDDTATFDSYTIGQIIKALRNTGILA